MAAKRAKTLDKRQFDGLLKVARKSEHPLRDEVAIRLSFFAGLRAAEIAGLRWDNNILDASGRVRDVIHITSDVGKRSVERTIPCEPELRSLLIEMRAKRPDDEYVFYALHNNTPATKVVAVLVGDDGKKTIVRAPDDNWQPGKVTPAAVTQWFKRLYAQVGYEGCSSHSGRRTFITARARLANLKKCSLVDVQQLAGHKDLNTTASYIEPSSQQRELVSAW